MSDLNRPRRARSSFSPEAPCLARRARCHLSVGCVALRPRRRRRRATPATSDALERLLDVARGLAARLWALID
jgi:hypothetical protein